MDGRWREVAERVLVRRYVELDLSVGLVLGDGGCLVVDTRGDLVQGAELAAAVRQVTRDPWTVAITHSHFDHCFGTAAFLPSDVWAHERCRADLVATGYRQRDVTARQFRDAGDASTADRIAAVAPVLPDRLVTGPARATLLVGGRPVVLAHFGPAHTDNDLVVHVPDAGVVFAGDLVEQGAPPAFEDAFPSTWPAALDEVLGLAPAVVVPGHGEPVDAGFAGAQRAEVAAVSELCADVLGGRRTWSAALARSPYPESVLRAAVERVRLLAATAG